jgi:hypothetical protein
LIDGTSMDVELGGNASSCRFDRLRNSRVVNRFLPVRIVG